MSCLTAAHPCAILNGVDVELHRDVKAVEEIPPKHQCVLWCVHSMDPPYTILNTGCLFTCVKDLHTLSLPSSVTVCTNAIILLQNRPDGMTKVFPWWSSILWQSWHLSPKKMSPCFPDKTQFSYISRFCGEGGISQNTCRGKVNLS